MGRSDQHDAANFELPVAFTVALLKMVDGDYDEGGAYWGSGDAKNGYMYRATAEGEENQIDLFFRAKSVDQAKEIVRKDYPLATFSDDTLDEFTEAYIEAALWSTTDTDNEDGDSCLDAKYSASDLAPETLAKVIADCAKFQRDNAQWLTDENLTYGKCSVSRQAGHDFLLTRNGHGCGFWDGDWENEAGEALSRASKGFGEVDFYAGDDGLIYC
jgi:hypothetical protein